MKWGRKRKRMSIIPEKRNTQGEGNIGKSRATPTLLFNEIDVLLPGDAFSPRAFARRRWLRYTRMQRNSPVNIMDSDFHGVDDLEIVGGDENDEKGGFWEHPGEGGDGRSGGRGLSGD